VHGALLALGELLLNSGDFMVPKFAESCDLVLKYKDSRNKLVRRCVAVSVYRCVAAFLRCYVVVCMCCAHVHV
jgi:FKBP12-rapamycin complex-associated protein